MKLSLLPYKLAVIRLKPTDPIPAWIWDSRFLSITRTDDELSLFCDETVVPEDVTCVGGWNAFRVAGQLDLSLVGILSSLAMPLATKQINLFSVSTHDTDYMVLPESRLDDAVDVLEGHGHVFIPYEESLHY